MTNSTTEAVQARRGARCRRPLLAGQYEPITEDDAFLRKIVDTSDLPALMVALAAVTGDFSILREDLRPPQPRRKSSASPHGGMTPEQQATGARTWHSRPSSGSAMRT